ncbi:MAG: hypothetical protein WAL76_03570, partial [Candidatus Sulfotelmatobacter sp.]
MNLAVACWAPGFAQAWTAEAAVATWAVAGSGGAGVNGNAARRASPRLGQPKAAVATWPVAGSGGAEVNGNAARRASPRLGQPKAAVATW